MIINNANVVNLIFDIDVDNAYTIEFRFYRSKILLPVVIHCFF